MVADSSPSAPAAARQDLPRGKAAALVGVSTRTTACSFMVRMNRSATPFVWGSATKANEGHHIDSPQEAPARARVSAGPSGYPIRRPLD